MASVASAHCPWLYVTEDSHPRLFFGESLSDREYHLPEAVSAAEVWQTGIDAPKKRLEMATIEEDGFVGLESEDPIEPRGRLQTTIEYGCYHGTKLLYYVQHLPADNPSAWPDEPADGALQLQLDSEGDELVVSAVWESAPLAGATITLTHERGDAKDKLTSKTDKAGVARFPLDEVAEGLNGLSLMHVDKNDRGEVDGEPYTSATHYLTATFNYHQEAAAKVSALPALPEAVSSFGAAACDGWVYVYSGHVGQAHDHSRENLSSHFRRARLDGTGDWEELPMGRPLQGLPLVTHGGKLYRVGGLDARNASGEEEDLHSVADFAAYDPASETWTDMPPLPAGRSSHNAVVVDGTLYVVGGWRLTGDNQGEWQAGALAFDLDVPGAAWRELPEPPFKRRALAVSHIGGQIAALCGMTDDQDLSKKVYFYDPDAESWSDGPEYPGKPFHGFGLSAWNLDGDLYASGMDGFVYRLNEDRTAWEKAGESVTKRFFHQLVPDSQGALLLVAGVSPDQGHLATTERITPQAAKTP
ncbi:N-acetylneuraminate epimerase [Botrimarina colliarenosi]|uniref:N-acetylneuraminate epimerase n=2 Tax=Botrimarina colliarenosi TaxID=2528001 RepID=A0A5C6AE82_9BACT|nr:N-acetylneuraminate epimerase [Botrimarina colliarenosi]